jgi:hypothetical protein
MFVCQSGLNYLMLSCHRVKKELDSFDMIHVLLYSVSTAHRRYIDDKTSLSVAFLFLEIEKALLEGGKAVIADLLRVGLLELISIFLDMRTLAYTSHADAEAVSRLLFTLTMVIGTSSLMTLLGRTRILNSVHHFVLDAPSPQRCAMGALIAGSDRILDTNPIQILPPVELIAATLPEHQSRYFVHLNGVYNSAIFTTSHPQHEETPEAGILKLNFEPFNQTFSVDPQLGGHDTLAQWSITDMIYHPVTGKIRFSRKIHALQFIFYGIANPYGFGGFFIQTEDIKASETSGTRVTGIWMWWRSGKPENNEDAFVSSKITEYEASVAKRVDFPWIRALDNDDVIISQLRTLKKYFCLVIARHQTPMRSLDDLLTHLLKTTAQYILPNLNNEEGTKLSLIVRFPGETDKRFALRRRLELQLHAANAQEYLTTLWLHREELEADLKSMESEVDKKLEEEKIITLKWARRWQQTDTDETVTQKMRVAVAYLAKHLSNSKQTSRDGYTSGLDVESDETLEEEAMSSKKRKHSRRKHQTLELSTPILVVSFVGITLAASIGAFAMATYLFRPKKQDKD